ARPVRGLGLELRPPGARESIVLGAAGVLGAAPLGVEPSRALEAMDRGEQRARVALEDAARDLLDAAGDAEAVERLETEGLEDQQVQGALDHVGVGRVGHGTERYRHVLLIVKM